MSILRKIPLVNAILNSILDAGGYRIKNLGRPVDANDAVTKEYMESRGGTPSDYATVRTNAEAGAAHAANPAPHVSDTDRASWNGKQDALTTQQRDNIEDVPNKRDRSDMFTAWDAGGFPDTIGQPVYDESAKKWYWETVNLGVVAEANDETGESVELEFRAVYAGGEEYAFTATRQRILTTADVTDDLTNPTEGKAAEAAAVETALDGKLDKVNPTVKGVAYSDSANRAATLIVSGGDAETLGRFHEGGKIDVKGGVLGGKITVRKTEFPLANEADSATVLVEDATGANAVEIRGGASRGSVANRAASIRLIGFAGGKEILIQSKAQGTYPSGEKGATITIGGIEVALVTDVADATKLTPVTVDGKTTAYTLGTDTVKKLMAGTTADLSGITAQDIEDYKKYRGEGRATHYKVGDIAYTEGGTLESNSYYCRVEYDETDGGNVGNPYYWGSEFFPTEGFKKLVYLFGSDNEYLGQTITTLAEASIKDKAMPTEGAAEGSVAARIVALEAGGGGGGDMTFVLKYNPKEDVIYLDDGVKAQKEK